VRLDAAHSVPSVATITGSGLTLRAGSRALQDVRSRPCDRQSDVQNGKRSHGRPARVGACTRTHAAGHQIWSRAPLASCRQTFCRGRQRSNPVPGSWPICAAMTTSSFPAHHQERPSGHPDTATSARRARRERSAVASSIVEAESGLCYCSVANGPNGSSSSTKPPPAVLSLVAGSGLRPSAKARSSMRRPCSIPGNP
jgi:hypothetical protein